MPNEKQNFLKNFSVAHFDVSFHSFWVVSKSNESWQRMTPIYAKTQNAPAREKTRTSAKRILGSIKFNCRTILISAISPTVGDSFLTAGYWWASIEKITACFHQIPPCSVGKSSLVCDKRKETMAYYLPPIKR